jgi:hypothetical protein
LDEAYALEYRGLFHAGGAQRSVWVCCLNLDLQAD